MFRSLILIMEIHINILFLCVLVSSSLSNTVQGTTIKECNCHCSKVFQNEGSVCKNMYGLKEQLDHVTGEIEKRTRYIGDLSDLKERLGMHEAEFKSLRKEVQHLKDSAVTIQTLPTTKEHMLEEISTQAEHAKEIQEMKDKLNAQENLYKNLLMAVEDLKKTKADIPTLPDPQPLVSKIEDDMLGDSAIDTRLVDRSELARNMSDLLAKVEVVGNLTSKVQEELNSERRVRRHLQEDLNETRTSIKLLNDKWANASLPMQIRNDLVEEITLSTLENLNKTIFEEQLQKIHYRLDRVANENETLDMYKHLEEVRDTFLNVSSGHVLQFEEDLRSLYDMLTNLNENITTEMVRKEVRLNALEAKTYEMDILDEQLYLLMNVSELMHGGIEEMWKDVQDVINDTVYMKRDINERISEIDNFTKSETKVMLEKFDNITSEISALKKQMEEGKEPSSSLKQKLFNVESDLADATNSIYQLGISIDDVVKGCKLEIQNVTAVWNASLGAIAKRITRDRKMEKLVMDPTCAVPDAEDDHLLMLLKNDSSGQLTLEFGCRPIGRHILNSHAAAVTCNNGVWDGPIPSCVRLLDEQEIDAIEAEFRDFKPCLFSFGNVPDPVDCAHYFECAPEAARRMSCRPGHHFSPISKMCEPTYTAECQRDSLNRDKLSDLIPPIHIDPDNIDKTFGLMGTGPTGELIVHPRTSFILHCLFPDSAWGAPSWRFLPGYATGEPPSAGLLKSRHISLPGIRSGLRRFSVSITGASSRDSGLYMCVTPRGMFNAIHVIVKSVQCPPIISNDEQPSNAYYRPHPEGEYRILSTPVEFQCKGGYTISAICKAEGTWSRPAPTHEECPQENSFWDCPPIDTKDRPNLILERDDRDSTITFQCTSNSRLIGNAFTRCVNGEWMHSTLPICVSIFS